MDIFVRLLMHVKIRDFEEGKPGLSYKRCLKTINSKKYGVDLVCFTSHPTTVLYSSINGWDESLRLLSLHDYKYLGYFKGHHDRVVSLSMCSRKECFIFGSLDQTVLLWDQRAEKCQTLLCVQGRPVVSFDDQRLVFSIAFGGFIRMLDARKYEKGKVFISLEKEKSYQAFLSKSFNN